MIVRIKKLSMDAVLPEYAHDGDAGMDLYSVSDGVLGPGQRMLVRTGIAIALPSGFEAQVRPKSGLALKNGITVLNTPGTVDQGYRGEVGVILINHSDADFAVRKGNKVAQLVFKRVERARLELVNELDQTVRGEGGYGSTGLDRDAEKSI